MWIEGVYLPPARRESVCTFIASAGGLVNFAANAQRVNLKLLWLNPAGVAAGEQCILGVDGKNNVGSAIQITILAITMEKQTDEMSVEDYGELVTRNFTVNIAAALDAVVIETLLKK